MITQPGGRLSVSKPHRLFTLRGHVWGTKMLHTMDPTLLGEPCMASGKRGRWACAGGEAVCEVPGAPRPTGNRPFPRPFSRLLASAR